MAAGRRAAVTAGAVDLALLERALGTLVYRLHCLDAGLPAPPDAPEASREELEAQRAQLLQALHAEHAKRRARRGEADG